MDDYLHTVGAVRKAMEGLPDDFPVNWYVDVSGYHQREPAGIQIPTTGSVHERTDDEMIEVPEWVKRKMLLFLVG